MTAYERPVEEMVINNAQKSKYFSKEADIALLCVTHEQGYGNWSAIKYAIRRDTRVRFDHLFMSRNESELQKRVDLLVKALEKEQFEPKGPVKHSHYKFANANQLQRHHSEDVDMSDEQEDDKPDQGFENGGKRHRDDSMEHNSEG